MHVKFLENKNCKIIWHKTRVNGKFWIISNLFSLPSFDFKPGSEIITTMLTFSTTVAPIYQLGLIPCFIDLIKDKFISFS